jgi:IS605 OrfB family transposase
MSIQYDVISNDSNKAVGIDLGLKDTATTSDGDKLKGGRHYRKYQQQLGIAQRANNKKRVKNIHAKIKNKRKDEIHKFTSRITKEYGAIFIGDVSSKKLTKTKMAKSVLDAGWFMLKTQMKYKAIAQSSVSEEINESYTTQRCSCCGVIPNSSPKGRTGLGIRSWICSSCGAEHDRDINAAKNILALGVDMHLLQKESSHPKDATAVSTAGVL